MALDWPHGRDDNGASHAGSVSVLAPELRRIYAPANTKQGPQSNDSSAGSNGGTTTVRIVSRPTARCRTTGRDQYGTTANRWVVDRCSHA
jgi:hypothetical protein